MISETRVQNPIPAVTSENTSRLIMAMITGPENSGMKSR